MRHALFALLAASCGRLGFGDHGPGPTGDGGSASGDATDGGNVPPFMPTWTNGTRFRARTGVVGDGGDPVFYGWRDTLLDTDCQNAVATDGVERCMPTHARGDLYYADASCTVPLGWTHGLCGHDSYAFFISAGQYHALPLTALYTGPIYRLGATCAADAGPSTGQLWSTGADVAPAAFAAATYQTVMVGAYNHVFGGWGDGSDRDLGALSFNIGSCMPTGGMASGTSACRPNGETVMTAVYSDAACTQRAFYSSSAPTNEFIVNDTTLCGEAFTIYDTTGTVGGGNYYTLGPGGCSMQAVGTGTLVTATAVDPFPHGTIRVGPRRGRIGYLYWDAGDGIAMPLADWDFDLARSCRPFIAQDGVVRCLPRTPKLTTANPDGTCTATPATVAANCYGVAPVDGVGYSSCDDGPVTIHTIAPVAAISYDNEATCTSLGPGYEPAAATGELPPTMFAPLTEVIE